MARTYAAEMLALLREMEAADVAAGYEPGVPLDVEPDTDEDERGDIVIRDVEAYDDDGFDPEYDDEYVYDDFLLSGTYQGE